MNENYIIDNLIPLREYIKKIESLDLLEEEKLNNIYRYSHLLSSVITYEMCEGANKIFDCGKYINRQPSTYFNTYEINGKCLFRDTNTESNVSMFVRIEELVNLNIKYRMYVD